MSDFSNLIEALSCSSRISKKFELSLGAVHGLGLNEYFVLYYLDDSNTALSRIALADQLGLTASGVTRMLNPMEKLGLIERQANERDARLSLVKLSSAGALKFKDAKKSIDRVVKDILSELKRDEKVILATLLNKIA